MLPITEIEELQKEAMRLAERTLQSLFKPASNNRSAVNASRNYYLDEGTYVQHVIIMLGLGKLDRYETTHVKALVFHISRNLAVQEDRILSLLRNELSVGAIEKMHRKDYDRVVDFLRDIDLCSGLLERQAG